jgi:hypothetical protein
VGLAQCKPEALRGGATACGQNAEPVPGADVGEATVASARTVLGVMEVVGLVWPVGTNGGEL